MTLTGEKVTDEIVPHIARFTHLSVIVFAPGTKVSPDALADLQAELPDAEIRRNIISARLVATP